MSYSIESFILTDFSHGSYDVAPIRMTTTPVQTMTCVEEPGEHIYMRQTRQCKSALSPIYGHTYWFYEKIGNGATKIKRSLWRLNFFYPACKSCETSGFSGHVLSFTSAKNMKPLCKGVSCFKKIYSCSHLLSLVRRVHISDNAYTQVFNKHATLETHGYYINLPLKVSPKHSNWQVEVLTYAYLSKLLELVIFVRPKLNASW